MGTHADHLKNAQKLIKSCVYRHNLYDIFSDCMEAIALSISNSVDLQNHTSREERYLEIVSRYERETLDIFPRVFAEITMALEAETGDALGAMFGALELQSAARGQFFTPYPVCQMMAQMTLAGSQPAMLVEQHGFITAMEPACGAGAMVIALAEAMRGIGINYQRHLHVTAVDIDRRAVHMAYIQLSLLHVPAKVVLGDSLSLQTQEHWYTPAHILGGWQRRLAKRHDHIPADVGPTGKTRIDGSPPVHRHSDPVTDHAPGEQLRLF